MTLQEYFTENVCFGHVRWHPTRNGRLTPENVSMGSHRKVQWLCEKGHEWEAPVFSVTMVKSGCPYCAGRRALPGKTDLKSVRPDVLVDWDFEKNTIDPASLLPSSHDKVWWKCDKGHSWQATVFSRTRENAAGCPYCTGRLVLRGFNDLKTLHPKLAKEWHEALNGALKPEDVSPGSNKKAWWICREGHVWKAAIYSRTRKKGSGCPICTGTVKQTKKPKTKTIRPAAYENAPVRLNQL